MIELNGVWKKFNNNTKKKTIKEMVVNVTKKDEKKRFSREWALQDINFQLEKNSSLGIIGNNGSGKSTLLNMILGTIKPSKGTVMRSANIGGLLELGSGFHPDLTGIENIYINASILGMNISEIKKKIDSIIDYSELEKSINWPIRTYSSGMTARLAFSILVHINHDILLIDEVLAVGDANFQKKCSVYFQDFTNNGGSLIVCSHNLEEINKLCTHGIWINEGIIQTHDYIHETIESYKRFIGNINANSN